MILKSQLRIAIKEVLEAYGHESDELLEAIVEALEAEDMVFEDDDELLNEGD